MSLIFVKKDAFALWVKNNSDTTATDAYYYFGLVDLDQTDDKGILEPLKIVGSKPTWIHKKDAVGAFSVIGDLTPPLPTGHRIFGFVGLNCFNCSRRKFYWVYQVIGVGGWYYEIPEKDSTDVNQLFDIAFHLKTDPNYYVSRIPLVARPAIED